jgi:formylglycine-generating enzyme required for sulfatase activity
MVDVPAGCVTLGTQQDGSCGFVWDNEGPKQTPRSVGGFQAATQPVSIGEFRDFVLAKKGYATPEFWEAQDFQVLASKQRCPSHWTLTEDGDVWVHYPEGTRNWREVRHRPAWCSLAEARAYCRAMSRRLMTEEEHALATAFDPCSARISMLGCGGWEHTSTDFAPLPGFKAMDGYEEYSTDFFDGKHFVLKGSSPYTPPSVARPSFRNFYQDVYPNPFAKFRCCR